MLPLPVSEQTCRELPLFVAYVVQSCVADQSSQHGFCVLAGAYSPQR